MFSGGAPTLDLGGLTLGLREAVIGLIGLVALYMAFVLLRMRHLRQKARAATGPASPREVPTLTEREEGAAPTLRPSVPTDPVTDWESPPLGLAEGMLRQGLAQELAQLRDEVDAIRGELAGLRADMQQEMAHLRAAQTVSPIYGDAMQMALSGYDAGLIAERCGIARGEAELVRALARSQNG